MASDNSFVVITRKTRLQELIERFNSWSQAKFYLEHNQSDISDYLDEHEVYLARIKEAETILRKLGRFQQLERSMLPNYQFAPNDIVVVIGQDGLVANTLKYLDGQPVIAVNPDPGRFDGPLLPFELPDLKNVVVATLNKVINRKSISFARVETNDGQTMRAVNDFFIGPKSHTSARYKLSWNGKTEIQSSSGIIVSTGFGSTGWFQSVLAGAIGISGLKDHPMQSGFAWDSPKLQFAVREPFPSQTSETDTIFGAITKDMPLNLESFMPENGIIFSEGLEQDYINFNSGTVATLSLDSRGGTLVVV